MVSVRSELLDGDHRLLYLARLMGMQWDHVDDEDTEPPVAAQFWAAADVRKTARQEAETRVRVRRPYSGTSAGSVVLGR